MTCQRCGLSSPIVSDSCSNCGQIQQLGVAFAAAGGGATPFSQPIHQGTDFVPPLTAELKAGQWHYAPFLKRSIAFVLDEFIAGGLAAVTYGFMASIAAVFSAPPRLRYGYRGGMADSAALGAGFLFLALGAVLAFGVYVFYFVKSETSPRQATFGKTLLGIRVRTVSGQTISVGQSLGRLLIKNTFSGLFFGIGFLMAAFTERKQALHDLIAGTIVTGN